MYRVGYVFLCADNHLLAYELLKKAEILTSPSGYITDKKMRMKLRAGISLVCACQIALVLHTHVRRSSSENRMLCIRKERKVKKFKALLTAANMMKIKETHATTT